MHGHFACTPRWPPRQEYGPQDIGRPAPTDRSVGRRNPNPTYVERGRHTEIWKQWPPMMTGVCEIEPIPPTKGSRVSKVFEEEMEHAHVCTTHLRGSATHVVAGGRAGTDQRDRRRRPRHVGRG